MTTPLSGTQFELVFGDYTARIASVGATLRSLTHQGRDLVVPFDADEVRPAFRGATLAPWPNRVVDGRYTVDGVTHQLSLSEPERGHALHGLASWLDFIPLEESADSVTLAATIEPQTGYPFRLQLRVIFTLSAEGLRQTVMARNTGNVPAPYGAGPHPYLIAGEGRVDDWTLTLPAAQVLLVTEDRLIPISLTDVATEADGALDFRTPRVIGETFIDHAFTELTRDGEGTAEVRLTAPSGTGVSMSWSTGCTWVQVHTADQPTRKASRRGLAVEPMTCPPDAFNSGTDLIMLNPGQLASVGWSIAAL
ncbi:aldose 1-epimerase family protein [Glaciibacter psychrotolerans]|uniref:Aldose 1-epimerase n=1 Tax=Glaciibacter psychrotolerans TaxID=670054 RepID=A0A7Z0EGG5_9MICO|nr:aldose 1-epimerase family protein [Leifsonia psychrotolerans]NYJ21204.1 aldose 1-epimerase [Leifsonia psychrotolerans]